MFRRLRSPFPPSSTVYDSTEHDRPFWRAIAGSWNYRGLIGLFVRRDLTVRYKRSLLGVSWSVLNPLLVSGVMWFVFHALFHAESLTGTPFIVYLLSGMIVVTFFQQFVVSGGGTLTAAASLLTKIYFPPTTLAFGNAIAGAINFLLALIPLLFLQLLVGPGIRWTVLLVPVPLVFLVLLIAGLGLIVSSYSVQYSDVNDLTGVVALLVGYTTPSFYPITIVPQHLRPFLYVNPLTSFVQIFRFLEYGGAAFDPVTVAIAAGSGVAIFVLGLAIFVRRWPRLVSLL
jgi:ABC-type polysaccharide/polyol phosphate export permease